MAEIASLSTTHESIMLWLLQNPHRSMRDCAAFFGYTQSWLSTVIHSDIFQAKLFERQEAVFVKVAEDIPAKLRRAADISIEKLTDHIERTEDPDFLLDATDKLLHRMGYAPSSSRNGGAVTVNQQNNFSVNSQDLAEARALMGRVIPQLPQVALEVLNEVPTGSEL